MASVRIRLLQSKSRARTGSSLSIVESVPLQAQTLTSTNTSTQSTVVSSDPLSDVWGVKPIDGAVWIKFGSDPTAVIGDDIHVSAGETVYFSPSSENEKIAVVDAQ